MSERMQAERRELLRVGLVSVGLTVLIFIAAPLLPDGETANTNLKDLTNEKPIPYLHSSHIQYPLCQSSDAARPLARPSDVHPKLLHVRTKNVSGQSYRLLSGPKGNKKRLHCKME